MEDGSGDGDEERFRWRGWRTVPETNPVNRAENEDGGQLWRRGWRTEKETGMEDSSGDEDGGRERVRGVRGAPRKTLIHNDLTLFRVGIFTTLKSVKHLSISHLQVAPNVPS